MNDDATLDALVDRVAELLHLHIGLRCESALYSRLRRAVRDEATAHGGDAQGYLAALLPGSPVMQRLLNRITVQETAFFRHPEQFEILARDILPTLRPPVQIWSAACSNGQEPYSLAMLLDESGVDGSVIATDLSTSAVQRTAEASYGPRELTGLSSERMARYLTKKGTCWEVCRAISDRVTVFRHNLLDPIPERVKSCQVVFCRNVLIYFSPQHAKVFLDRLADAMPRKVWLFLSSTETIWQVSNRYEAVRIDEGFVHRNREAHTPVARSPVRPPAPARTVQGHRQSSPRKITARTPVPETPPVPLDHAEQAALAARVGQEALSSGDCGSAVVEFRKWAYLTPDDVMAHVHLGLALEAAGERSSARRAYSVAQRVLVTVDPAHLEGAMEGFAIDELARFLQGKKQEGEP
ncbi:CheR family methyltransferase [Lentzea aerocolonigenes]|uniref:CheR family methyltransferase n=1 Tax=Lentzea aerocolonigenes TaxID=68170 RepID=UPI0004C40635|nr:CheR family methyltransferase [Lentzea aerocolonigenes]MCP2247509.1 chemotaxis protein methyltransferase CheR [Lentzea aerocolonigenes]